MSTEKGRIRASTGNVGFGRVPKIGNPGEYRKCGIRASTGKGRIKASAGKVEIRASTGNGESE